jgi:hypothetical protein
VCERNRSLKKERFLIKSTPGYLNIIRDFCSLSFFISSSSLFFVFASARRGLPFAVDQKEVKVLSKSSFCPHHGFFFPAHIPEDPPKTDPAFAGPEYFDRPPLLFTSR